MSEREAALSGVDCPAFSEPLLSRHNISTELLQIQFWGVRGELSSPMGSYGGHTGCVSVAVGPQQLVFDAGTGLAALGQRWSAGEDPVQAHLFLTQTQWDRTQGFSCFQPAFGQRNQLWVYGPVAITGASIKQQIMDQLRLPYSAIALRQMQATIQFQDLQPGTVVTVDPQIQIETRLLERATSPGSIALGYRLTWQGRTLIYATALNMAQLKAQALKSFLAWVEGADVVICGEADVGEHLRSPEFHPDQDWLLALDTARLLIQRAGVQRLIFARHRPLFPDWQLHELESRLQKLYPQAELAFEGMRVQVPPRPQNHD